MATRRVSTNLQQGRAGRAGDIEVKYQSKKVKRHSTISIQGLSLKIVSGAGDRMWSQSMRLCDRIYFRIQTVDRQGRGVPSGERSKNK